MLLRIPSSPALSKRRNEAGVRNYLCSCQEIVPIARNEHAVVLGSVPQHILVFCLGIKQISEFEHFVTHRGQSIRHIIGHIVVEREPQDASLGLICRATSKSISPR